MVFNGGAGAVTITNSDIRSNASSSWTGDPGTQGKIQYHSNRWYIVADSSSNRIVQFRRNGSDVSYIDNSGKFIGTATNALALDGLSVHGGRNDDANKIVRTNASGYLDTGWINTTSGDRGATVPSRIYASNDAYIRYYDLASFRSFMNVTAKTGYQGREQSSADSNYWVGSMGWGTTTFENLFKYGSGSIDTWSNPSDQPSLETSHWVGSQHLHYHNGSTSGYGHQIVVGAGNPAYMYVRGKWGTSAFTSWAKMWNSANDGDGSGLDADNLDGYSWMSTGKSVRANEFYADNWFRNYNSGEGLYNQATGQHWYSDDDDYWNIAGGTTANGIRFRDEHAGTIRGYVYANSSNNVGFLDAGGSWAVRHINDSGTYFYTDGSTEEFKVGRDTVTGNYGTVQTSTTKGGWGGYSINGNWVFMSNGADACGIYNDTDNEWAIYCQRNNQVNLRYDGSTKLATTGSGIQVTGNVTATGDVTAFSDIRLKENVQTIDNALDKVTSIRGVTYTKDGKDGLGVIAQEVEEIIPQVVLTADDEIETKSVAYGNIVGLLIEAIKEQQAQIDDLNNRLIMIEGRE